MSSNSLQPASSSLFGFWIQSWIQVLDSNLDPNLATPKHRNVWSRNDKKIDCSGESLCPIDRDHLIMVVAFIQVSLEHGLSLSCAISVLVTYNVYILRVRCIYTHLCIPIYVYPCICISMPNWYDIGPILLVSTKLIPTVQHCGSHLDFRWFLFWLFQMIETAALEIPTCWNTNLESQSLMRYYCRTVSSRRVHCVVAIQLRSCRTDWISFSPTNIAYCRKQLIVQWTSSDASQLLSNHQNILTEILIEILKQEVNNVYI